MIATESKIVFQHEGRTQTFYGCDRIGFTEDGHFVISGFTTPADQTNIHGNRGGYFTSIPISPLEYRQKHGASYDRPIGYETTERSITVYDEFAHPYKFTVNKKFVKALAEECEAQELRCLNS